MLLKAGSAENRAPLRGLEGNRRWLAAERTIDLCLRAHLGAAKGALGLALFAVLGVVPELFFAKKTLLVRREYKLGAAIHALQNSVGEFHGRLPQKQGIR